MTHSPKRKNRLFGILSIVLIHVTVFFILEGTLRLFKVGIDPSLIRTKEVDGETYLYFNNIYTYRYFGADNTPVPEPNPEFFKAEKAENTYRIYIIGESTSRGFPYSKTQSFPRQLEQMLNAISRQEEIEVINFSIDATNSHIGVDMVKELINYPPDLAIVYYGHNEFIGIGGAGQSKNPVYKLNNFCYRSRVYQLIKSVVLKRNKKAESSLLEKMAGKQEIEHNSELFNETISDFHHYYAEMLDILTRNDIMTITCGVAKNLKDFQPINNAVADSQEIELLLKDTANKEQFLKGLEEICQSGRNIAYGIANLLLDSGNKNLAKECYEMACDFDATRLRAPTDINTVIKDLSSKHACSYIDMQKLLDAADSMGIAGNNQFLEHVHPLLEAHTLMAIQLTKVIAQEFTDVDTSIDLSKIRLNANIIDDVALSKILYNLYTQYPLSEYGYFNSIGFESLYKEGARSVEELSFKNKSFESYYMYLEKYFNKYDKTNKIHFKVGVDYFNKQDYNRAYREFAIAYDQNPMHVGALNNMALIRYISNDKETPAEMFKLVTQIRDKYSIGLLNYWLYVKAEKQPKIRKELEKRMGKLGIEYKNVHEFLLDDLSE